MPKPPYRYLKSNAIVLDLSDISLRLQETEEQRQEALDKSRSFQKTLIEAQRALEQDPSTGSEWISKLQETLQDAIEVSNKSTTNNIDTINIDRIPRTAYLNQRVEDLCRFKALHHFLTTAELLGPSDCRFSETLKATDEEFLAGALMGLCQELSRYSLGRATDRDASSVKQARDVIQKILDYLLLFDFRNGFLRRKYDGTKYALKSVETLLYELSVTGASLESEEPGPAKKPRLDAEETTNDDDLEALRARMEHRDSLRETLIKNCRDGQKAAKQAIYALHRKDYAKASKLIGDCENCIIEKLLPIVREEPPLRYSSFGDVLEEYAEAKLFYAWLLGKNDETMTDTAAASADGTLLLPHDFVKVQLDPEAYLGGLCDLTGEIGRFAVQRGTDRDHDGVHLCLEANTAILRAIQGLDKTPSKIHKKMDTLRKSVSKIERMIYEMSLSQAAGMNRNSEVDDAPLLGE